MILIKRSWIVVAEVTSKMEYVTDECTEQEARDAPDGHAVEERSLDTLDLEVESVEPNE